MSKYARTRKAICRISMLKDWPVSRSYFRKNPSETWKRSYKKFRKSELYLKSLGMNCRYYSYKTGKDMFPPCKWKDALELWPDIWHIVR